MTGKATILERERSALAAHRAALRSGAALPPPKPSLEPTFAHGFMLTFVLVAATLRDVRLRGRYVRVTLVRIALVAVLGAIAAASGAFAGDGERPRHVAAAAGAGAAAPAAAARERSADDDDEDVVEELGDPPAPVAAPVTPLGRAREILARSWKRVLTALAVLAALQSVVVFFSRRWDDWLGFHAAALAHVRPEDAQPPPEPKLSADLRWLYRKAKRRWRGYVVLFAGLPVLMPLRILPGIGGYLFTIGATLWGWYWFGVFSAAKSAHAWADEAVAPPPLPIRTLTAHFERFPKFVPLGAYGRLWTRLTRGVNSAASTFERAPRAYLGLALARAILSLPGLYLVARPLVPVAAGRICAEADPWDRFSAPAPAVLAPPMPEPLCEGGTLGMNEVSRREMRP